MHWPIVRHQFCRFGRAHPSVGITWAIWIQSYPFEFGYSYMLHNTRYGSPCDAGVITFKWPHWMVRRGTTTQEYPFKQGLLYVKSLFWPVLRLVTS